MPVLPALRSQIQILRRCSKFLRRRVSAGLQLLEALAPLPMQKFDRLPRRALAIRRIQPWQKPVAVVLFFQLDIKVDP